MGDAVYVGRGTRWGNPFEVKGGITPGSPLWPYLETHYPSSRGLSSVTITSPSMAVELYTWWLYEQPHLMLNLDEIAGKDLACWCPLTDAQGNHVPCHADVLLELANGDPE